MSDVRRELYVLRWGEAGADAHLAERARQQAADDAQLERDNRAVVLEMLADREAAQSRASAPAAAPAAPVAPPAAAVPVLGADRRRAPTVQQEIAPYVARVMALHPDYTADKLYAHMKREAGQDHSPFSRPAPGGELFCPEAGKTCGRSSVVTALTAYNKQRNRPGLR